MTDFDRVAWCCSWVAPASWFAAAGAFVLNFAMGKGASPEPSFHRILPTITFVAASLGLATQTLLTLHVMRARIFSSDERKALLLDLWLGGGYGRWRSVVRSAQNS